MTFLFKEYGVFVEADIPKEDARFLLPYSNKSNFYYTVNARELCKILYSMLYGRGMGSSEIRELGNDLLKQAAEICLFIFDDLLKIERGDENTYDRIAEIMDMKEEREWHFDNSVELLILTENPEMVVARAALIGHTNFPTSQIENILKDQKYVEQIIEVVLQTDVPVS